MLCALRTQLVALGHCGLLAALSLAAAGASAQQAAAEPGHGRTALPAADVVPVLIDERAHAIRAHASLGYGYTEDVLGADDAHHRTGLDLALSYQLIEAVALAGRFDARLDSHDGAAGGDEGFVTQAWLMARAGGPVSSLLRAGVEGGLRLPGASEIGGTFAAISPEARAVLTLAPRAWWLSGSAGFRLDRAREGAEDRERLSLADRVGLGASDANAVLLGLAAVRSFGRFAVLGEWSWDVQAGARAAAPLESPMRLTVGARVLLSRSLQAQALATLSPSARPMLPDGAPLYVIEPRVQIALGLGMRFGDDPSPPPPPSRAQPAPVKLAPPPLPSPPTTRSVSGRVVDSMSRAPIAGATIATSDGTVKVVTDAAGLFQLEDMPLAFIELRVHADGFKAAVVPVGAGADQGADLEIEIEPERTSALIRGTVSNFQGRAVAGHVLVQPGNVGAVLDASGSFEVEVPAGEYTVLITASGHGLQQRRVHVERGDVAVIVVQLQSER
jgi:hypothetical protein